MIFILYDAFITWFLIFSQNFLQLIFKMSSCKVICKCIDCIEKNPEGWTVTLKTREKHLTKYQNKYEINMRLGTIPLEFETKVDFEETR